MSAPFVTNSDGKETTLADSVFNSEAGLLPPDADRSYGLYPDDESLARKRVAIRQFISVKLASLGLPVPSDDSHFIEVAGDLLHHYASTAHRAGHNLCPVDSRIQAFIDRHFAVSEQEKHPQLPDRTFTLDCAYMARELSLPFDGDKYVSPGGWVTSYRVRQGILSNPLHDKRTTKGVFHIAEGGYPIPGDKISVPKRVFGNMLYHAFHPPHELLELPFTSSLPEERRAYTWVSGYLRPVVVPGVPGVTSQKRMEVRVFAPGSLVGNIDFLETVFGNGGDPAVPENDAALDPATWTGTTGCVILAPHLTSLRKKDLGLPSYDEATEGQRASGMCWKNEDELYHDGNPFKLVFRTAEGMVITILGDTYYGYSKKEVKSMISFSSNFFGISEEEHAGGALTFPAYSWGEDFFAADSRVPMNGRTFADSKRILGDRVTVDADTGALIDKICPNIIYVPGDDLTASIRTMKVSFRHPDSGEQVSMPLRREYYYVLPSGYTINLQRYEAKGSMRTWWHIVGYNQASMTYVHKPATVSGGGKSEVSKPITDYIQSGNLYVNDLPAELDAVEALVKRNYNDRFRTPELRPATWPASRPVLAPERSLGSLIKLMTPSSWQFSDEYNEWLRTIPATTKAILFLLKAVYKTEWGDDWRQHFSVTTIDGQPGHQLEINGRPVMLNFLRVGHKADGTWRIFQLRQDFHPSMKLQMEDDISASTIVPVSQLPEELRYDRITSCTGDVEMPCVKITTNCEHTLFQRPDDAVNRGIDAKTEEDLSRLDGRTFISNFEALTKEDAEQLAEDVVGLDRFTAPVRVTINQLAGVTAEDRAKDATCATTDPRRSDLWVCSAIQRRLANGTVTSNPRYLQRRPDEERPLYRYLFEAIARLTTGITAPHPVIVPVSITFPGRRCNGPDYARGIRPLSAFGPIHYQELPELFADLIPSVTGRSPSTTGTASTEGPLTKGPFNCLPTTADLNNALLGMILTHEPVFTSCAGDIGDFKVDHDISMLVPEVFARMTPAERRPEYLIENKFLEKVEDFEHEGRIIRASRLGYRITSRFITTFFGRVFATPQNIFEEKHLRPELASMDVYVDALDLILSSQKKVAQQFLDDGTIINACPPLRALLYCMATGTYEGKELSDPSIRALFSRENVLNSDWYQDRLIIKQQRDIAYWTRSVNYIQDKIARYGTMPNVDLQARLKHATRMLSAVSDSSYVRRLRGTIGADAIATAH